jgi:hypothetical protein
VIGWKLPGADQREQGILEDLHTPDHPGHVPGQGEP